MKKTVLVLTAIERAFYSASIKYQLIEPVLKVSKGRRDTRFVFLFLVPFNFYFIRSDLKRSFSAFRERRRKLRSYLEEKGCRAIFFPVLFPVRHRSFYLTVFAVLLFLRLNFPVLFLFEIRFHPSLIHARGYPASLLAFLNKKLKRTKFIFDMRDVYTKKGVEAGVFRENDISFRLWHHLEMKILKEADGVIVTSNPFKDYVRVILRSDEKIYTIPNSVDRKRFYPNTDLRKTVRKTLGVDNKFVIIHSGTFSTSNDISLTARYFKKWKCFKKESYLLILVANRQNNEKFGNIFAEEQVDPLDFKILNPEPEEVPDFLRAADIGLHLESRSLATEYCIAIKDGEYLATGLPVVCTPYLKGIAPLIEKYDCGIVSDPDRDTSFSKEQYLLDNFGRLKKNTKRIVDDVLSLELAASKLGKCYEELLIGT